MRQDSARSQEAPDQTGVRPQRLDERSSVRAAIRVASFASEETSRWLRHAFAPPVFDYTRLTSLESLEEWLKAANTDVLVLEPDFADAGSLRDQQSLLVSISRRFTHIPTIIISRINAQSFHNAREFLRPSSTELVLTGVDDSPVKLASVAAEAYSYGLEVRMIARLAPQLQLLPASLQSSIALLFRDPQRFPTVAMLAAASGISARGMDRAFQNAGLASAKSILRAAAALRAWRLLKSARVVDILESMHYGSERRFQRDLRYATGRTPRSLRAISSTDELLELVWLRLQRGGLGSGAATLESQR